MLEKWGLRFGKIVSKVKPRDVVKKWKIFIGDTVEIIEGKDKGKQGKVINIIKPFNQVFVEGLNLVLIFSFCFQFHSFICYSLSFPFLSLFLLLTYIHDYHSMTI